MQFYSTLLALSLLCPSTLAMAIAKRDVRCNRTASFEGLALDSAPPNGYGSLSWQHLTVTNITNINSMFVGLQPTSGNNVLAATYPETPFISQSTGNNLLFTLDSFSFACAFQPTISTPYMGGSPCTVTVVTKAGIQGVPIATYGPFKSTGETDQTTHRQAMTTVQGPFSGQYVHFVVSSGPGNEVLFLDDIQVSNTFAGDHCTSLGK